MYLRKFLTEAAVIQRLVFEKIFGLALMLNWQLRCCIDNSGAASTIQVLHWQFRCCRSLVDVPGHIRSQIQIFKHTLILHSPENAWIWTLVALHQCLDLHIVGIEIISFHFIPYVLRCGASCDSPNILAWKHRCMWCATKLSWWEFCLKQSIMSRRW